MYGMSTLIEIVSITEIEQRYTSINYCGRVDDGKGKHPIGCDI